MFIIMEQYMYKNVNFKYEKLILERNFNNLYGIYFNIIP